jgi:hypothetical protein
VNFKKIHYYQNMTREQKEHEEEKGDDEEDGMSTSQDDSQTMREARQDLRHEFEKGVKSVKAQEKGTGAGRNAETEGETAKEVNLSQLNKTGKRAANKTGNREMSIGSTRSDSSSDAEGEANKGGMLTRSRSGLTVGKETASGATPNGDRDTSITRSIRKGTADMCLQDNAALTLQYDIEEESRMPTVQEVDEMMEAEEATSSTSNQGAPRVNKYIEEVVVDYEASSDEDEPTITDMREVAKAAPLESLNMTVNMDEEDDDSTTSPYTQVNHRKRKETHEPPPPSVSSSESTLSTMSVSSNSTTSKTRTAFPIGMWKQGQINELAELSAPGDLGDRVDRVRRKVAPTLSQQLNCEARLKREQAKVEMRRRLEREEEMKSLLEFYPAPKEQQELLFEQTSAEKVKMELMADVEDISHAPNFETSCLLIQGVPTWFTMTRFKDEMSRLLLEFSLVIKSEGTIWPVLEEASRAPVLAVTTAVVCTMSLKCGGSTGYRVGNGVTGHFPAVLFHTAEGTYHGTQEWIAEFTICPIPAGQREYWQISPPSQGKNSYKVKRVTIGLIRHCGANPAEIEFRMRVAQRLFQEFDMGRSKLILLFRIMKKIYLTGVEHIIILEVAPQPADWLWEQLKRHMRNHRTGLQYRTIALPMVISFKDVQLSRGKTQFPLATRMCGLRARTTHIDVIEAVALHPTIKMCLQGVLMAMTTVQIRGEEVDVAEATLLWSKVGELPFICPLTAIPDLFTHEEYFLDGSVTEAILQKQEGLMEELQKLRIQLAEPTEDLWWKREVGEPEGCISSCLFHSGYLAARCWTQRQSSSGPELRRGWTVQMKWHCQGVALSTRMPQKEMDSSDFGKLWMTLMPQFVTAMAADPSFEAYLQWCAASDVRRSVREELNMGALERKALRLTKDVAIWKLGKTGLSFRLLLPKGGEVGRQEVEAMLARPLWVTQAGLSYQVVALHTGLLAAREGLINRMLSHTNG